MGDARAAEPGTDLRTSVRHLVDRCQLRLAMRVLLVGPVQLREERLVGQRGHRDRLEEPVPPRLLDEGLDLGQGHRQAGRRTEVEALGRSGSQREGGLRRLRPRHGAGRRCGRGGRDYWTDIKLETLPDVSREHFRLRRDPASGQFFLKDLSRLGTTINGEKAPSSVDFSNGEKRDLNVEVPVPAQARIGLAGVVFLDFQSTSNG